MAITRLSVAICLLLSLATIATADYYSPSSPPVHHSPVHKPTLYTPPTHKPTLPSPVYTPPAYKPTHSPPVYTTPVHKPTLPPPVYTPPAYKPTLPHPVYKPTPLLLSTLNPLSLLRSTLHQFTSQPFLLRSTPN
ncbi:unnamed protein product [Brassica oleracea var. botrytis]|uniref:Extensin domain-containing protein n=2 Tax=Brassica TaxID=3705 RepID=A0A3P6GNJ9_BRAOL|nr:unnamed protein product [Brassica napus]VDD58095.1 unnamed protein product [Brassica oleracea]